MTPAHLVLLNQYFPPDTAATAGVAARVAGALARRHRVTVLAGRPSYAPTERHGPYLLRREHRDGVTVERVGSTSLPRHRMPGRLSNYLSYLALAIPRALALRADGVISMTDPPVAGIAGALVAARRRCPLIYCIQDLYPDLVLAGELLRPGPWMRQWERWHRWALAQAERIVVLGDDIRERLLAKGLDGSRVVVVRTGAPAPTAPPIIERNVVHEIRGDFPFVVMYAGNLGHSGDWAALVEAAGLLESHGVGFVFIGDGALRGRAVALAARHPNVRFLPFRPAAQVSSVLAAADLHVVAVRDGLEGIVVPSKLYAILAAGKPVLAAAPEGSEVARIVRRHHCGLVVEPGAPPAVAAAVRTAMASPERLAAMAQRAMQAASTFDQARELETFARIVDEVIDQRHQGRGAQCAH